MKINITPICSYLNTHMHKNKNKIYEENKNKLEYTCGLMLFPENVL
jgi:hypothetical protein